jgi:hypothetical protein
MASHLSQSNGECNAFAAPFHDAAIAYADYSLPVVDPVQPRDVLLERAAPRNWHCQKQCIESGIVEAFADVVVRIAGRWLYLFREKISRILKSETQGELELPGSP